MRHDVLHFRVVFFVVVVHALRLCSAHHGPRHGVREVFFEARRQPQDFFFVAFGVKRHHVGQLRRRLRERSRLIEHHGVDFRQGFEVTTALYEHAALCTLLHGGQNRQGRRKTQRAGVVHHQDGRRTREASRAEEHQPRQRKVKGHDGVGQMFRLPLNAGFTLFGRFNEFDDLVKTRAVPHLRRLNIDFAVFDNRPRKHGAAQFAVHRQGFPGHRRLVYFGVASHHFAVHRDGISRTNDDDVFGRDVFQGLFDDGVALTHPNAVNLKGQLIREARQGLLSRVALEHFAHAEKQNHQPRGLKVAQQKRHADRGRVQYFDVELSFKEILHPAEEVGNGSEENVRGVDQHRQHRTQHQPTRQGREIQVGSVVLCRERRFAHEGALYGVDDRHSGHRALHQIGNPLHDRRRPVFDNVGFL